MYRDHDAAARIRLSEVAATPSISPEIEHIYAKRVARTAAGAAGVLSAAALAAGFIAHLLVDVVPAMSYRVWHDRLSLTLVAALASSWLLVPLAYLVGRLVAPRLLRRAVDRQLAKLAERHSDSPLDELARREHGAIDRIAAQHAQRLERASLALPLAALALLAPLTIHAPIALLAFRSGLDGFGDWINLSYRIVGHAHIVLLLLSLHHVRRLVDGPNARASAPETPTTAAGWHALAWTTLAGALPGVVFLAVPPILVFITGMIFVPVSFRFIARTAVYERAALAPPH